MLIFARLVLELRLDWLADSSTHFVIVGQLSLLNMFNIRCPIPVS